MAQGINFLAGFLLLHTDEENAFWLQQPLNKAHRVQLPSHVLYGSLVKCLVDMHCLLIAVCCIFAVSREAVCCVL
jgi:hypothetical protein